jgi:hypothetical protein
MPPLSLPSPIMNVSDVTEEAAGKLLMYIRSRYSNKAGAEADRHRINAHHIFCGRASMPPARRLAVNLKAMLNVLADKNVQSVIPDGLTGEELEALIWLQTRNIGSDMRETAQGLLNVYERYQLLASLSLPFRKERKRVWNVELVKAERSAGGTA